MKTATIRVNGLKVAVSLRAAEVPRDLVPMEGPAGEPVIELAREGSSLAVRAKFNGKNYRRMLKTIDEQGPDNVAVVLQGLLRPAEGGGFVLEGAGFQGNIRRPQAGPPKAGSPGTGGQPLPPPPAAATRGRPEKRAGRHGDASMV